MGAFIDEAKLLVTRAKAGDPGVRSAVAEHLNVARACMNSRASRLPCNCFCCEVFVQWHGIRRGEPT